VPPPFAKRGTAYIEHLDLPFPLLDPRLIHSLVGLSTLLVSIVLYVRAYRYLSAFKKRYGTGLLPCLSPSPPSSDLA